MQVVAMLALMLIAGVGYILYVLGRIAVCLLCQAFGRPRSIDHRSDACDAKTFSPRFHAVHFYVLAAFCALFGSMTFMCISPGDWRGWETHPIRSVLATVNGPFTVALLSPTDEHWRTAWRILLCVAPFLLWGFFCQFVRLPFQRNPQSVAIIMWMIGLMAWFEAGILALLLAA